MLCLYEMMWLEYLLKTVRCNVRKNLATELWEYSSFCFHRLMEYRSWKGPYNHLVHCLHFQMRKLRTWTMWCVGAKLAWTLDFLLTPLILSHPPPPILLPFIKIILGLWRHWDFRISFGQCAELLQSRVFRQDWGSWVTRIVKSQVRPCKNETFIPVLERISCL